MTPNHANTSGTSSPLHAHTPAGHPAAAVSAQTTVIAADTVIRGEMVVQQTAYVLGRVEGKLTSAADLVIGPGAECRATVQAAALIVEGTIEGDVIATERLELNATAKVVGDITAARLTVAEGAVFTGHCTIGPEAARRAADGARPAGASAPGQPAHPAGEPVVRPRVVTRTATHSALGVTSGSSAGLNGAADLDATLAGLESKLAGLARVKGEA
jgi:cytoskeletal protein CcmA (bactofilin family)